MSKRRIGYPGKRILDLIVAVSAIGMGLPVFVVVAGLIRLRLGQPVFFRQVRPGLDGRLFTLYKFRTMSDVRDDCGQLLPDAIRLTTLGRFLRSTSLDELPELFNVVKGEMSIVGPRPLLTEYLELYSPEHARRHLVRPGMTGWAQVNGRNAISWKAKFEYDVWYVDHQSLSLDLRIIARTAVILVTREGVSQPGQATVEHFQG